MPGKPLIFGIGLRLGIFGILGIGARGVGLSTTITPVFLDGVLRSFVIEILIWTSLTKLLENCD